MQSHDCVYSQLIYILWLCLVVFLILIKSDFRLIWDNKFFSPTHLFCEPWVEGADLDDLINLEGTVRGTIFSGSKLGLISGISLNKLFYKPLAKQLPSAVQDKFPQWLKYWHQTNGRWTAAWGLYGNQFNFFLRILQAVEILK